MAGAVLGTCKVCQLGCSHCAFLLIILLRLSTNARNKWIPKNRKSFPNYFCTLWKMASCATWRCDASHNMLRTLSLLTCPMVQSIYYNLQHRFPRVRWTWCLVSTFRWVVWVSVCDSPFCRTGAFWLLTFLYSCGCQLYTLLFLANVRKVGGESRSEFHINVVNLPFKSPFLAYWVFAQVDSWQMVGKLLVDFIPGRFFFGFIDLLFGGKNSGLVGGLKMQEHGAVPYISWPRVSKGGGDAT